MSEDKLPAVAEYHNEELVDLAFQLYARAAHLDCSKALHERAMEAKAEVLRRLEIMKGPKLTPEDCASAYLSAHKLPYKDNFDSRFADALNHILKEKGK